LRAEDEFVEFARASASRLQQAAYLMCRNWHLAQDVTQTALTKVYLAWRRVGRDGGDPYAYARTVLLRVLLDHKRLKRSGEVATETTRETATEQSDPATRLTLLAALSVLAPRDRAIVVLRYWEDQSVELTAEVLGLSPAVVRSRSVRALSTLRGHLGADKDALFT
jgi:RNA polymerase sigma-70 factor (sigma-E family)